VTSDTPFIDGDRRSPLRALEPANNDEAGSRRDKIGLAEFGDSKSVPVLALFALRIATIGGGRTLRDLVLGPLVCLRCRSPLASLVIYRPRKGGS